MMWSQTVSVMSVALILLAGAGWILSAPEPEREPLVLEEPAPVGPPVVEPPSPDPVPVPDVEPGQVPWRATQPMTWCAVADAWPLALESVRETGAFDDVDDAALATWMPDVAPCEVLHAVSETMRCSGEEDECVGLLEWLHDVLGGLTNLTGPIVANVTEDVAGAQEAVEAVEAVEANGALASDPVAVAAQAAVEREVPEVDTGSPSTARASGEGRAGADAPDGSGSAVRAGVEGRDLAEAPDRSDVDEMSRGHLDDPAPGPASGALF